MKKKPLNPISLEREVIAAVVVLYLLISAALLGIHYMQPEDRVPVSSSPAHAVRTGLLPP